MDGDKPRHIGNLPYQAINKALSLNLQHDTVYLSEKAIHHIWERHPNDYHVCMEAIEVIVSTPDFTGQSPLHPDNFILIKQVQELMLLAAISVLPDEHGDYPVQSSYTIDNNALHHRLRKGFLKRI